MIAHRKGFCIMKMNLKVRLKSPWFWIGLLGVVLTAMGVSPETLTSWSAVYVAIQDLISNPFMLGSVIVAVLGVFIDPTTAGIGDSEQALTYDKPKKE
jgi:phi LC3 family holin